MTKRNNIFYDKYPFKYGYSSKDDIISSMNSDLKNYIKKAKNGVICDIGCGCGRNLLFASKYSKKCIGVDISNESLKFAKKFIDSINVEFIQGDNLSIPLDNNVADVVISDGVIHHTGDTVRAFDECVRILKPNGLLYLAVYKKNRYYPLLYNYLGGIFRLMHKSWFGRILLNIICVNLFFIAYKLFKGSNLKYSEIRNIFFDYFVTPIATFQSKSEVQKWILKERCMLEGYTETDGNCHVFFIRKL